MSTTSTQVNKPQKPAYQAPQKPKYAIDSLRPAIPMTERLSKVLTSDQWIILTKQVFPQAKDPNAIAMGLLLCQQQGLDLFRKHVDVVNFGGGDIPYISEDGLIALAEQSGTFGGWGEERFGPVVTIQFGKGTETVTGHEWAEVDVFKIITLNGKQERVLCRGPRVFLKEEVKGRKDKVTKEVLGPNEFWSTRTNSQLSKNARRRTLNANFQSIKAAQTQLQGAMPYSPPVEDIVDNEPFQATEIEPEAYNVDNETGEVLDLDAALN